MKIAVLGLTDTRVIVYTLLKLFENHGDVLLVTDKVAMRRLYDFTTDEEGYLRNIFIKIIDSSPDDVYENIGHPESDFDIIIFDCTNYMPDDCTYIFYADSGYLLKEERDVINANQDIMTIIYLNYNGKKPVYKNSIKVNMTRSIFRNIELFEAHRQMQAIGAEGLNKYLSTLMSVPLMMTSKNIMNTLRH